MTRRLPGWVVRRMFGFEGFTQAIPAPRRGKVTNDLFPG
jgi:hypothetical protein